MLQVVTSNVCAPASDCIGNHFVGRFHPGGNALNVLVNMLLSMLASRRPRSAKTGSFL